jgi:hypothetical protein
VSTTGINDSLDRLIDRATTDVLDSVASFWVGAGVGAPGFKAADRWGELEQYLAVRHDGAGWYALVTDWGNHFGTAVPTPALPRVVLLPPALLEVAWRAEQGVYQCHPAALAQAIIEASRLELALARAGGWKGSTGTLTEIERTDDVLEWDGFLAAQQRGSDAVAFSQFMRRLGTAEKATHKLDKLEAQAKALVTRDVRQLETEALMTMAQPGVS